MFVLVSFVFVLVSFVCVLVSFVHEYVYFVRVLVSFACVSISFVYVSVFVMCVWVSLVCVLARTKETYIFSLTLAQKRPISRTKETYFLHKRDLYLSTHKRDLYLLTLSFPHTLSLHWYFRHTQGLWGGTYTHAQKCMPEILM